MRVARVSPKIFYLLLWFDHRVGILFMRLDRAKPTGQSPWPTISQLAISKHRARVPPRESTLIVSLATVSAYEMDRESIGRKILLNLFSRPEIG